MPAGLRPRRLRGLNSDESVGDRKVVTPFCGVALVRSDASAAVTFAGDTQEPRMMERGRSMLGRSLFQVGDKETRLRKKEADFLGEDVTNGELLLGVLELEHGELGALAVGGLVVAVGGLASGECAMHEPEARELELHKFDSP